jgi:tetratricopeptide (TPR) repeat protein
VIYFELKKNQKEETSMAEMDDMAIAIATEISKDLYKRLTKETLKEYESIIYELDELEGDYIAEYDRREREGGKYEPRVPDPSDPRTGIYGKEYAATGFYSAGSKYKEREDFDQAIANFGKAKELRPRHICAYFEKAKCHFAKKEYWYAICEMWNAINLNPVLIAEKDEDSRAVLRLLTPESIAVMEKLLVDSLYYRGAASWYYEDYDDALQDYNEVIRRDPAYIHAYHARLMVLMKFRDYEKALLDCEKLLAEHHDELYAIQCRGIAYNSLDRIDEAIADFDLALSRDPELALVYTGRSSCYYKKKDYQKAVSNADEAIKRGYGEAYFHRGIAYSALGEYDKAIADFDEALRFDDEDELAEYQREKAIKLKAEAQGKPIEQSAKN